MASYWSRYGAQTFYRILMFLILLAAVYSGFNFVTYMLRVDGGYSQWTVYGPCSAACGGGKHTRTRTCNDPLPKYGGRNCSWLGPPQETEPCNTLPCPVNGGYGQWSEYGPCSKECGGGEQRRTRACDSPFPLHNGKTCKQLDLGPDEEVRPCNEHPCPVHGGYSEWSEWTQCNVTCGTGKQARSRQCNNPEPQHGGKNCADAGLGPDTEEKDCVQDKCPEPPKNVTEKEEQEEKDPKDKSSEKKPDETKAGEEQKADKKDNDADKTSKNEETPDEKKSEETNKQENQEKGAKQ